MTTATMRHSARARLGRWPYEPDVVHLVLTDHQMVPDTRTIRSWIDEAHHRDATRIRTGALFPLAAAAFIDVGFQPVDTLTLLEARLEPARRRAPFGRARPGSRSGAGTRRMRAPMLAEAALLDRAAFGDPWGNDVHSLAEVMSATPRHRARVVESAGRLDGFAISGQSGTTGYLQRLAVLPDARRRGVARALVADAMEWMCRCGSNTAMVNTASENHAALALYEGMGFRHRPERLTILELALELPTPEMPAVR